MYACANKWYKMTITIAENFKVLNLKKSHIKEFQVALRSGACCPREVIFSQFE